MSLYTSISKMMMLRAVVFLGFTSLLVLAIEWPVPYRRFPNRPPTDPYCKAGLIPFCPTGMTADTMPSFLPTDDIEVFALKAPVWEFKFGDLLGKFHIIHDAIGFRNTRTGLNYTMEWYELFQLFNCTFPHLVPTDNGKELLWCNQGAACIYEGIDDKHWTENGTLVKVGDMTGEQFIIFSEWAMWDNNTGIYYETWIVEQEPDGKVWFNPYDCSSFVIRAFDAIAQTGAKFNHSVHLNYTKIHLYSDEPIYLGNASVVFGPNANQTIVKDIIYFYSHFQSHQSPIALIESLIMAFEEVIFEGRFYLFYNFEYWYLPLRPPHVRLTFEEVPLP